MSLTYHGMKVMLVPEVLYRVTTESGESIGIFKRESDWEGLVKLSGAAGTMLVEADSGPNPFDLLAYRSPPLKTETAQIVRASESIRNAIQCIRSHEMKRAAT